MWGYARLSPSAKIGNFAASFGAWTRFARLKGVFSSEYPLKNKVKLRQRRRAYGLRLDGNLLVGFPHTLKNLVSRGAAPASSIGVV